MSIVIVVCLFLHYGAAMTIFGASASRFAIANTEGADPRLRSFLPAVWATLAVSAIVLVMASAGAMGGAWQDAVDVDTLATVMLDTGFGQVWQAHLILVILAALALWRTRLGEPWLAVASLLVLASMALVGHAAMIEGFAGEMRRLNQAVHLLAGGAWVGGVVTLAGAMVALRARPAQATRLLRVFSRYGIVIVALLLATGIINSVLLVGTLRALFGSPYGWVLLAKLVLVAAMVATAAFNRFVLLPRLEAAPEPAGAVLRRAIGAEIAIGLGIVLLASLLGTIAPPAA